MHHEKFKLSLILLFLSFSFSLSTWAHQGVNILANEVYLPDGTNANPISALGSQPVPIEPDLKNTCASFDKPVVWSYCITTDKNNSKDVLYFMHGLGGAATDWYSRGESHMIREQWRKLGVKSPVVVSISFGKMWLLAEKNSSTVSGLFEFVTQYVIPTIEQSLGGVKGRRLLAGMSMGGFNASQLLLKMPQSFSKVVLACPAITTVSAYATQKEISDFIKRENASGVRVKKALEMARAFYPDELKWNVAFPLLVAKRSLNASFPPLHISCGNNDKFGFFSGAKEFGEVAFKKGMLVRWQELKGGHCTMDPIDIANFLAVP